MKYLILISLILVGCTNSKSASHQYSQIEDAGDASVADAE